MTSPLDAISGEDARAILHSLAATYPEMKRVIFAEAEELLKDFDCEDIALEVSFDLDMLQLEDILDPSSTKRANYVLPDEMASQLFEEALSLFETQIIRYEELDMREEAKRYCMGVLLGLYSLDQDFQDQEYVFDTPRRCFERINEEWRQRNPSERDRKDMEKFISRKCPDWA